MTANLIFWAQSLNNRGPDHFALRGEHLTPEKPEDRPKIEQVIKLISGVTSTSREVYNFKWTRLILVKSKFVIYIFPEQEDEARRKSPIACYGEMTVETPNEWIDDTLKEIQQFASSIHRTLTREAERELRGVLKDLKKKGVGQSYDPFWF